MSGRPIEHVQRGGLGLFESVVDGFEAHPHFIAQRRVISAIAGRVHGSVAGAAIFIHHNAVLAGKAGCCGQLHVGEGSHPDHQQICLVGAAIGAYHPLDPRAALQANHTRVAHEFDALGAVLMGKIFRHVRGHDSIHHPVGHLKDRDGTTHLPCGGGRLQADIPPADDDRPRARLQAFLNLRNIPDAA
jgi:hypothetical protein